ncbi:MAG TPA: acetolactate synthase small subunit [Candidatus Bathyarchaeia archaeon]|nr:acetolactate synthase small subunit [Candidatus Bathyarchaeia archaeon]
MKHTVSVLVQNKPGVLARTAGLFSRRGYNIESLTVGVTENEAISRMTIVVAGDDTVVEQVTKQLNKLIEVIKVSDLTKESYVDRELVLIKVTADSSNRAEIMQIVNIFRARIVDVAPKSLIIEVTGDQGKLDALVGMLKQFGVKEIVRTGTLALGRGPKVIQSAKD